jgi:hypothetical protein
LACQLGVVSNEAPLACKTLCFKHFRFMIGAPALPLDGAPDNRSYRSRCRMHFKAQDEFDCRIEVLALFSIAEFPRAGLQR